MSSVVFVLRGLEPLDQEEAILGVYTTALRAQGVAEDDANSGAHYSVYEVLQFALNEDELKSEEPIYSTGSACWDDGGNELHIVWDRYADADEEPPRSERGG